MSISFRVIEEHTPVDGRTDDEQDDDDVDEDFPQLTQMSQQHGTTGDNSSSKRKGLIFYHYF